MSSATKNSPSFSESLNILERPFLCVGDAERDLDLDPLRDRDRAEPDLERDRLRDFADLERDLRLKFERLRDDLENN